MKPLRYFGPANCLSNLDLEKVPTPSGQPCGWCEELILVDDVGVVMDHFDNYLVTEQPYHKECLIRMIVGSVSHIKGECSCPRNPLRPLDKSHKTDCVVHDGDDPNLTKREAAKAAFEEQNKLCPWVQQPVAEAIITLDGLIVRKPIPVSIRPDGDEWIATFVEAKISSGGDTPERAVYNLASLIGEFFLDLEDEPDSNLGPAMKQQKHLLLEYVTYER